MKSLCSSGSQVSVTGKWHTALVYNFLGGANGNGWLSIAHWLAGQPD